MEVSYSGAMRSYDYPEISMDAPAFLDVKKFDLKDRFPDHGCCYNVWPKAGSVMILHDKFPDLSSMQDDLTKLTGIDIKTWKPAGQGRKGKSGWVWRNDYQAFSGDTVAYAVLGRDAKNSYIIILCTDKKELAADQADYTAWLKSIRLGSKKPPK